MRRPISEGIAALACKSGLRDETPSNTPDECTRSGTQEPPHCGNSNRLSNQPNPGVAQVIAVIEFILFTVPAIVEKCSESLQKISTVVASTPGVGN